MIRRERLRGLDCTAFGVRAMRDCVLYSKITITLPTQMLLLYIRPIGHSFLVWKYELRNKSNNLRNDIR